MMETWIYLAVGLCLVAVLIVFFLLQEQPKLPTAAELERHGESQAALMTLELELPPRLLADRIFAQQDWNFVLRESPVLQQKFLQERKAVALLWLQETRERMGRLLHFHRIASRGAATLNVAVELKTVANYFAFLGMVALCQCLIHLLGPFRVRGVVGRIFGVADPMSLTLGRTLAALEPSFLARIRDEEYRQSHPVV